VKLGGIEIAKCNGGHNVLNELHETGHRWLSSNRSTQRFAASSARK
jgi:hypothetical protein